MRRPLRLQSTRPRRSGPQGRHRRVARRVQRRRRREDRRHVRGRRRADAASRGGGDRARGDSGVPDRRHGRRESRGRQDRSRRGDGRCRRRHGLGVGVVHHHRRLRRDGRQRQLLVGVAQVERQVALRPRHVQLRPGLAGASSRPALPGRSERTHASSGQCCSWQSACSRRAAAGCGRHSERNAGGVPRDRHAASGSRSVGSGHGDRRQRGRVSVRCRRRRGAPRVARRAQGHRRAQRRQSQDGVPHPPSLRPHDGAAGSHAHPVDDGADRAARVVRTGGDARDDGGNPEGLGARHRSPAARSAAGHAARLAGQRPRDSGRPGLPRRARDGHGHPGAPWCLGGVCLPHPDARQDHRHLRRCPAEPGSGRGLPEVRPADLRGLHDGLDRRRSRSRGGSIGAPTTRPRRNWGRSPPPASPALLVLYHRANPGCDQVGASCGTSGSEAEALAEMHQFYAGKVVEAHDLDVF